MVVLYEVVILASFNRVHFNISVSSLKILSTILKHKIHAKSQCVFPQFVGYLQKKQSNFITLKKTDRLFQCTVYIPMAHILSVFLQTSINSASPSLNKI